MRAGISITIETGATVRANGGDGGTPTVGETGGGGAGGGGRVDLVAPTIVEDGTVEVNPGTPGVAHGTGTNGGTGSVGNIYRVTTG